MQYRQDLCTGIFLVFCLGLATAASSVYAQSRATLYGRLDLGYAIGNGGSYEGRQGNDSKFQLWNGASSASVWGIKGSEDLGSGTKVFYHLEAKINAESGASSGFTRLAFVGISGRLGTVQLGRQRNTVNVTLTPYDLANDPGITSPTGNAGIYASGFSLGGEVSSRFNSMLTYSSPEFRGFRLHTGLILKNDDIWARHDDAKTVYELGGEYRYGKFSMGVAYRSKPYSGSNHAWGVGLKYTFGTLDVAGGYIDNHDKEDGRGVFIGAVLPYEAWRFGAQLAYNMYDGDDGKKPMAWTLFSHYYLSKRTKLYMQYGRINADAKAVLKASRKYSTAVGITHSF